MKLVIHMNAWSCVLSELVKNVTERVGRMVGGQRVGAQMNDWTSE